MGVVRLALQMLALLLLPQCCGALRARYWVALPGLLTRTLALAAGRGGRMPSLADRRSVSEEQCVCLETGSVAGAAYDQGLATYRVPMALHALNRARLCEALGRGAAGRLRDYAETREPGDDRFRKDRDALFPVIADLRTIKTPAEIEVLRYVNYVSSMAHSEVMRAAKAGMMEYQLESLFQHHTYTHGGCRHMAYTCRGLRVAPTGRGLADMHRAAERAVLEGLRAGGVVRGDVDAMLDADLGAVFMPHGLGHHRPRHATTPGGYLDKDLPRSERPGLSKLRTARVIRAAWC
ncbi:manganese ion binding protein [Aureococcus anophagefferens]|nr:manganese ion binding protein [Aureococcus anophagefferens]